MYLELLEKQIDYWNNIVAMTSQKEDLKIEIRKGYQVGESSKNTRSFYICLFKDKNKLFVQQGYASNGTDEEGFELCAERVIKDLITFGISNTIEIADNLRLSRIRFQ